MASEVELANAALTLLGESRITTLADDVKAAREINAIFALRRDGLLGGYDWSFAKTRTQLSALVDVPPFQYALKYQLPSDCLRVVMVGDIYAGVDMADYRSAPTEEFTIEGREILTDMNAPLNLRYIKRVTDTGIFAPNFNNAFAADIARTVAESLTQSSGKRDRAEAQFRDEISKAIRAGAIELPPKRLADDEWLLSRL